MSTAASPAERLGPAVPLEFDGFLAQARLARLLGVEGRAYATPGTDPRSWYAAFATKLREALDSRRFFPVYRMGDGEFRFAVGPYERLVPWTSLPFRAKLRRARLALRGGAAHASGSHGYGWERYSAAERTAALQQYAADLRLIATQGYLALGLDDTPLYGRYAPHMLTWFAQNDVAVTMENYLHVYGVYALLHGRDREWLLGGRRVLVVNHAQADRGGRIRAGLRAAGAASVEILSISRDRAMLEQLDVGHMRGRADLVLVGAGVGASRMLAQLEPLGVPALDVGFVLDILDNPELRWERPYCVPDWAFDLRRVRYLTPKQHASALALWEPTVAGNDVLHSESA